MKNFVCIIICGFLIFSLNGCKKNVLDSSNTDISTEIDGIVNISCKNDKYKGKIIHKPEGLTTIILEEPQNLKGLTYSFNGGKYEISMQGLSGEFTANPFSKNSPIFCIDKVLNSLKDSQNIKKIEKNHIKIDCDGTEYELTMDSSGKIQSITAPSIELEINLQAF